MAKRGRPARILSSGSSGGNSSVIVENNGTAGTVGGSDNSVNDGSGIATAADGSIIIEPREFGTETGIGGGGSDSGPGDAEPRRRGRKPGTGRKSKGATLDLSGVELLLYSTHGMLAQLTKVEEIALDKPEAELLAKAVVAVSEHYSILSKVSAEAVAWANLLQVCAMIYGPRVMAYKINRAKKKQESETVINAAGMFGGGFPR